MPDLKPIFEPIEEYFHKHPDEEKEMLEAIEWEKKQRRKGEPFAPWLIPTMTNVYQQEGPVYLWVKISSDFYIEECGHDRFGVQPKWLVDELSESGLEGMLSLYRRSLAEWCLVKGIGCGQPFCVEIYPPHYYQSGWETPEWDVEWEWEVVKILPRKPAAAASSWERYLRGEERAREYLARAKARVQRRRMADPRALFLRFERYYARGHYDYDMQPPGGLQLKLCSKHTSENNRGLLSEVLHEVKSDSGDREELFRMLFEWVVKEGLGGSLWNRLRKDPLTNGGFWLTPSGLRSLPEERPRW